jgi:CHAT domain-containing protein
VARVALLEYFTHDRGGVVVLLHPDLPGPVVEPLGTDPDGAPVTGPSLRACATRLIVDYHGLPGNWDQGFDADRYRQSLRLPPAVNAARRAGPVLQRKLAKPAFGYDLTYWRRLGPALLPPAILDRLAGCDLLCVVPHGPLHALPFAALELSDGELLIDRYGVSVLPAASVMQFCQAKNRARGTDHRPRTALVAAVAAVEDADPADFEEDASLLDTLLDCQRLAGPDAATRPAVSQAMGGYDIVHLACHGVFGADLGADAMQASGLVLSDGTGPPSLNRPGARQLLSARDVLALSLDADLVALRACSTARADVQAGDELLGLIRAFLFAGAPSLLAALWNVHKVSSRLLLEAFYRNWLSGPGMPKWRALQQAQRWLRGREEYAHPYHWAPFVLVGDWY